MSNNYETVFILTPVLSDDQAKEAVKKVVKFLKDNKAQIVHEENWGLRKLAYPIQKKSSGFYYLIEFKSDGALIADLEVMFKRDERVIRFLTLALDKYAVEYNERRRNKKKNTEKTEKAEA